jgi:Rieske Fe-S protein
LDNFALVEPEHQPHDEPHLPAPTLWPIGFAIGVVVALVGLIINLTLITPIGVAIAIVFGFFWARDATRELRGEEAVVEPERRDQTADQQSGALVQDESPAVTRSVFLEGATLGLGAVIGVAITVPVAGFALLPSFLDQPHTKVDLGPISNFEIGLWYITTFVSDPAEGAVSRRTAFIRNNGPTPNPSKPSEQVPSFSVISNHCAHLGCPVQANGPTDQYIGKKIVHEHTLNGPVTMDPAIVAGYGCPCHGGQYDPEGNRIAGPPVRALDRYAFEIHVVNGEARLVLLAPYSVSHVDGTGATAKIYAYKAAGPGEHIDGPEQILYPIQPPRN